MDWLARYQAVIVCAEKIVRLFGSSSDSTSRIPNRSGSGAASVALMNLIGLATSELKRVIGANCKNYLTRGFIRPCSHLGGAPVLFVKKENRIISRMCINYGKLNKLTVKESLSTPKIDNLFDQLMVPVFILS
ncbi:hypothetical protein Tco_0762775 [Tanacetum coccineum]